MSKLRVIICFLSLFGSLSAMAITFSDRSKDINQLVDSVNRTVTLIFPIDTLHYALSPDSIRAVYAWGSVSDYQNAVSSCLMTDFSEDSCFYRTFSYDQIARPGDSGQPEFEFYVLMTNGETGYFAPCDMQVLTEPRLMFWNGLTTGLVVVPGGPEYMTTDWDELYARNLIAQEIRPLSDYNLNDPEDQHRISNFRLVPGTTQLYRSYHPYYAGFYRRDTEVERLHWVGELATRAGINSAICLTTDMSALIGQPYVCAGDTHYMVMPPYYETLINNGNLLSLPTSASLFYYYPDSMQVAEWLRDIILFLADNAHSLPVQVHCSVGADRTGVVCAILSALCGVSWQEIMADYAATGDMRTQTYRHPNRLRYMFERLTGLKPDVCTQSQLAAAIRDHLVRRMNVLTDAQIDGMVQRLTTPSHTSIESINIGFETRRDTCFDLLGRNVGVMHSGFVIRIDEQGQCTKLIVRP